MKCGIHERKHDSSNARVAESCPEFSTPKQILSWNWCSCSLAWVRSKSIQDQDGLCHCSLGDLILLTWLSWDVSPSLAVSEVKAAKCKGWWHLGSAFCLLYSVLCDGGDPFLLGVDWGRLLGTAHLTIRGRKELSLGKRGCCSLCGCTGRWTV